MLCTRFLNNMNNLVKRNFHIKHLENMTCYELQKLDCDVKKEQVRRLNFEHNFNLNFSKLQTLTINCGYDYRNRQIHYYCEDNNKYYTWNIVKQKWSKSYKEDIQYLK
jgi:hypothetical protein